MRASLSEEVIFTYINVTKIAKVGYFSVCKVFQQQTDVMDNITLCTCLLKPYRQTFVSHKSDLVLS